MFKLQILADANIPCVDEAFGQFGTVRRRPGSEIRRADVRDVDVLLVRSVTSVGPDLLDGSDVHFVGSATTGTDHVNAEYLRARNIEFAHAPGSNAASVADYVVVALLKLARQNEVSLQNRTVGLIGCGNIGSRLARRLPALGMRVLRNDPPRAEAAEKEGRRHDFVGLEKIVSEADVVTLHVPLTSNGAHPTYHLVDATFLRCLNPGAWLLNTSRGSVVDGDALRTARVRGQVGAVVLDVWENEPSPDPALLQAVDVATPHIAGYAYDGKVRGTAALYKALCEYLEVEPAWDPTAALRSESKDALRCRPPDPRLPTPEWFYMLARQAYALRTDDASMRRLLDRSEDERAPAFRRLRKEYRRRRELQQHAVPRHSVPSTHTRAVEMGLTMQLGS